MGKPKLQAKVHTPKEKESAKMLLIEKPFIKKKMDDKFEGPFLILRNTPKHATVMRDGKAIKIPWDRAKIFNPREEMSTYPLKDTHHPMLSGRSTAKSKSEEACSKPTHKTTWIEEEEQEPTGGNKSAAQPTGGPDGDTEGRFIRDNLPRTSGRQRKPTKRFGIDDIY